MSSRLEIEYSIRVKSLDKFHDKCLKMHPDSKSKSSMERIVYTNSSGCIARITKKTEGEEGRATLDFKDDREGLEMKSARETIPIDFPAGKEATIEELLKTLGFIKKIELKKSRTSYNFDKYKIDLDEYSEPETAYVFEIEANDESTVKGVKSSFQYLITKYKY